LVLDWRSMLAAVAGSDAAPEPIASGFHDALCTAILEVAQRVGRDRVVLTGGCFQNALLTERTADRLRAAGFLPCFHHRVPPNDGGLAVGQAIFASRPLIEERD
jgi:hydrogenase maturation protein HypF